jgi:hypothetical protein
MFEISLTLFAATAVLHFLRGNEDLCHFSLLENLFSENK